MSDLPARFTIEQRSDPLGINRYLGFSDEGVMVWASPLGRISVFKSEQRAHDFRRVRMGCAADDAVVVRHTIH